MLKKIKCLRCGRCCIIFNWKYKKWIKCPYLEGIIDKFTWCRIYKRRINKKIGNGFICNYRKKGIWDIPNCPYNTDKTMHPAYSKD